jgi:peptide/nickel transport system substrate-binding protein
VATIAVAVMTAGAAMAQDQKGTLIVAIDNLGTQSMDPIQEGRPANAHFHAPMYDSLVGYNYEKGGIGPGVANSWELSDDGLYWTFHLRDDVKWHNGEPLTAHDVKFSLERTMREDSLASRRAQLAKNVKNIEVVDDHTVRIYTDGVQVYFPTGLSRSVFQEGQLMPKNYIEEVGDEGFRKKPIGSGPWKFVANVPGDKVEYEAVDYDHWRGKPHYKKLEILLVPEESTRVAMLQTGEAGLASISPEAISEARAADLKVLSVPATTQGVYQFYGLHLPEHADSPLQDVRVREALSLAIDRQAVIDHVMYGEAGWPMPMATFPYTVDADTERWQKWAKHAYRYDPARAKELLAEAGYPNGFDLNFANQAMPGTPWMTQIGLALADFWSKIGVNVKVSNYEWGTFRGMLNDDQPKLAGGASMFRTAGRPVATTRYQVSFGVNSPLHQIGTEEHCPQLCQEYAAIYKALVTETDAKNRAELTDRMIELMADSWMVAPIVEGRGYWAVNTEEVGKFDPIPGRHELGDVFERIPRSDERAWN